MERVRALTESLKPSSIKRYQLTEHWSALLEAAYKCPIAEVLQGSRWRRGLFPIPEKVKAAGTTARLGGITRARHVAIAEGCIDTIVQRHISAVYMLV